MIENDFKIQISCIALFLTMDFSSKFTKVSSYSRFGKINLEKSNGKNVLGLIFTLESIMSDNGKRYDKIVKSNYVLSCSVQSYIIRTNSFIIERARGDFIC